MPPILPGTARRLGLRKPRWRQPCWKVDVSESHLWPFGSIPTITTRCRKGGWSISTSTADLDGPQEVR